MFLVVAKPLQMAQHFTLKIDLHGMQKLNKLMVLIF